MARMLKPDRIPLRSCRSQIGKFHLRFPFLAHSEKHVYTRKQAAGSQALQDKGMSLPFTQLQTLILPPSEALRGPEPEAGWSSG